MKILTITDHKTHGAGESIYQLLKSMSNDPRISHVHVASRGQDDNRDFFQASQATRLFAHLVDEGFSFSHGGEWFEKKCFEVDVTDYDVLFIRLDRPVSDEFLDSLSQRCSKQLIINNPDGVKLTGSKRFLLDFLHLCPPLHMCSSLADIEKVAALYPVVLKPLHGYGGKGLIRIDGEQVWDGDEHTTLSEFREEINSRLEQHGPVLAVKFLKNIHLGDKRVVVVNGNVLGAMLRIPRKDSWLANMTQGGTTKFSELTPEEYNIAETISPHIAESGVAVFGFDTLVDDSGKRVLSEINTLNVGGFLQAEQHSGKPVVATAAKEILAYAADRL